MPVQTARIDKVLHFSIYSVLAFLLARQISFGFRLWQAVTLAIAFAMAFGAFDEWHQQLIPGRSTELADWIADSFGAVAGASAAAVVQLRRRGRQSTLQST